MGSQHRQRVAVITTHGDAHLPFVERHLDNPLLILDPRDLLKGKELTYSITHGSVAVAYERVKLDNIVGVWYRKPLPVLRRELPVLDDFKLYSQNAIERHAYLLLAAFEQATWVSDYYALSRANNKSLQLAVAQRLGFNVPATIMTSDSEAARQFIKQYPQSITKPIAAAYPVVNGEQKVLLTNIIDKDHMSDLTNLHLAPSIFQQAIDVIHDVRVTVVGDKAFAAIVRTDLDEQQDNMDLVRIRDNRLGHYEGSVHIEVLEDFPELIAKKCIAHTAELGLNFGAIDLMIDKEGKWWFLENNPNGQWAYIEEATGLSIGKTLADLLQGKQRTAHKKALADIHAI